MKDLDRNTKQRPPGRDRKPSECLYLTFFGGGGAGASVNRHIENNMTRLVWREKEKASDTKARLLPSSLSVRVSGFLLTYPPNVQTKLCVDKYARRVVYGVLVSFKIEPA